MCMRRAQHRGVGGAGPLPHIVGEAPAPGEQCRVLHAFHRASTRRGKVLGESGALGMRSTVQGTIGEMVAENAQGTTDSRSFVLRPARHSHSLTRIGWLFFLYVP